MRKKHNDLYVIHQPGVRFGKLTVPEVLDTTWRRSTQDRGHSFFPMRTDLEWWITFSCFFLKLNEMLLKRIRVIKGCNYCTVVHVCFFAEVVCLNFVCIPSKKLWSNEHSFSLETKVFNMAFTHWIPSISVVELTVEKTKFKGISKI